MQNHNHWEKNAIRINLASILTLYNFLLVLKIIKSADPKVHGYMVLFLLLFPKAEVTKISCMML